MIDNNKENSEYILDEGEFEEDQPELVFKQEIKKRWRRRRYWNSTTGRRIISCPI